MERFANRLSELLASAQGRDASFSRTSLAEHIGVTRQTLWNWERGYSEPTIGQALRLAEGLGISVYELGYDTEVSAL